MMHLEFSMQQVSRGVVKVQAGARGHLRRMAGKQSFARFVLNTWAD